MSDRPIAAGDIVAGKYRVLRVLGEGGMGVVLGAEHVTLGERVALKVLRPDAMQDGEAVARFLREARAAARIKGENVARVLDVGAPGDGTPYIAMEYLEGHDLARLLTDYGVMAIPVAVDYVLQACEALAEAHALGIVHRDVKPSNLFLTQTVDGAPRVKVLDFGISKAMSPMDATRPDYNMTATQTVLGSPSYMAPEQMRSSRRVDGRTDIWAVGTILHELLTGEPPFEATTMPELCAMILQDPAPPLRTRRPDAPEGLERVVLKCLEKDPNARFETVQDLARELAPFGGPSAQESAARVARVAGASGRFALPASPSQGFGSTPSLADARSVRIEETKASGGLSLATIAIVATLVGLALIGGTLAVVALRHREAPSPAASAGPASVEPPPSASPQPSAASIDARPPVTAEPTASAPIPASTASVKVVSVRPTATPRPSSTVEAPPAPAPKSSAPSIASSRYD